MPGSTISVASWNVEHFKVKENDPPSQARLDRVVSLIQAQDAGTGQGGPDVFAILEVTGKEVFQILTDRMPEYQFHLTEGAQTQEILLGVHRDLSAFFTQRTEYKTQLSVLRPGALLTITKNAQRHSLLFLHTKSLPDPRGFGIRNDQLEKAFGFRKALDKAAQALGSNQASYAFLGDLNTMGMNLTFSKSDIDQQEEIDRLKRAANSRGMKVLDKTKSVTWWNGQNKPGRSNLDHVVATKAMKFTDFGGGTHVKVIGWPEKDTPAKQKNWIGRFSDHGMLYFEIVT